MNQFYRRRANGKEYEVVDGLRYMDKLEKENAETVIAKKAGRIAIIEPEGDKIVTYTSNGNIETEEAVRPGYHVVAKAKDEPSKEEEPKKDELMIIEPKNREIRRKR